MSVPPDTDLQLGSLVVVFNPNNPALSTKLTIDPTLPKSEFTLNYTVSSVPNSFTSIMKGSIVKKSNGEDVAGQFDFTVTIDTSKQNQQVEVTYTGDLGQHPIIDLVYLPDGNRYTFGVTIGIGTGQNLDMQISQLNFTVTGGNGTGPVISSFVFYVSAIWGNSPDEAPATLLSTNTGDVVQIGVTSDSWGCQLGSMTCNVVSAANCNYSKNAYPGTYAYESIYATLPPVPEGKELYIFWFRPDLQSVVLGCGSTLYAQCHEINDQDIPVSTFFENILKYSTARFMLSGLLFGEFKVEWLLQKYTNEFLSSLATNPNLNFYLQYFVPGGVYFGLEKYFR